MPTLSEKPEIQCPVCDSTIPEGAEKCPECGLDRAIIEMGDGPENSMDELDEQLDELEQIEEDEGVKEEEVTTSKNGSEEYSVDGEGFDEKSEDEGSIDDSIADLEKELDLELDEDTGEAEEELELDEDGSSVDDSIDELEEELELDEDTIETEEEIIYECPVCEEDVAEDAEECPSCGIAFGEEEEEEETQERFEDSMKKANSKISTFDDETVPKEHFEQLIEEARSLADASRYNEGIKKIEEALEFGDKLEEISERVGKLEENIQVRRKKGMNYEPFEKKLEEVKEKVRKGKVDKALSIVDETIRKIKRRKKEERTDIKKRINETVQDLNEILEIAKKFEMDLGDIRSIISKSLDLSREGRVEKALEVLEKARDKSSRILSEEIHNTISELKEKKDSIFDDKKRKELEKYLEDASKAIKRDRFQKTYELITKCKKITKKSGLKVGNMSLTEIINIKNLSEDIGLECGDIDEMITEAKEEHKRGNTRRAKNKLRKAKEELMRRVPQGIQNVMKEGMNELEEAKKRDEDISKPVSHLKQSNLMIKKKNFVEALEYINKFTNTLEKIKEKDGSPSATVSRVKKKTRHEVKKKETTKPSREVRTRSVSQSHQKERDWTNGKASTPSSKDKEKSVEFDVDEFYEGSTNLLEVKDLSKAYDLFKKLLEKSQVGVCVTREYPEKAKKKYDLEEFLKNQNTKGSSMHSDDEDIDFSMIWLSNVDSKETVQPKDLEKLSLKLESFITRGMGIILFNGFEYLVSNNNFKTVIHLIQSLKDQVAMGGSILLITVSPDAFNKTQLDQLEREVDEVFP